MASFGLRRTLNSSFSRSLRASPSHIVPKNTIPHHHRHYSLFPSISSLVNAVKQQCCSSSPISPPSSSSKSEKKQQNSSSATPPPSSSEKKNQVAAPKPMLTYHPLEKASANVHRFYSPVDDLVLERSQAKINNPHKKLLEESHCIGPCSETSVGYVSRRDGSLFVYNPFTQSIVSLPPLFLLESTVLNDAAVKNNTVLSREPNFLKKLIFLWDCPTLKPEERVCFAIYGNKKQVAFCRKGDTKWTWPRVLDGYRYNDFVHYKDQIYYSMVYTATRDLFERWDLSGCDNNRSNFLNRTEIKADTLYSPDYFTYEEKSLWFSCSTTRYLVKSGGDILLVARCIGRSDNLTHLFAIYKLDLARKKLISLDSIGDRALFVGANRSAFFVSTSSYPNLKKNSIYFSNDIIERTERDEIFTCLRRSLFTKDCHDFGIFDMKEKTVKYCYYPLGSSNTDPPPFWLLHSEGN